METPIDRAGFERLAWIDKQNMTHEVPWPLTAARIADLKKQMEKSAPLREEDTDEDGTTDTQYHVVRKYRDSFLPSITLSLALEYMHKKLSDVEVVLGKYIRISSPEIFDLESQAWVPYRLPVTLAEVDDEGNVTKPATWRDVPEVRIPIDETGAMLINFMGSPSSANPEEHQTYPVRSFSGLRGNASLGRPREMAPDEEGGQHDPHGRALLAGHRGRPEAQPLRPDVRGRDPRQRSQHHPDEQLPELRQSPG